MGITYAIIACYIDKGMKSRGSKCLMEFNQTKLLDYQIEKILLAHNNSIPYEIIIISNFDTQKILKYFGKKITVINCDEDTNPVARACSVANHDNIFFIDYGCIYTSNLIKGVCVKNESVIISTKNNKISKLDIGVTTDYSNDTVQHLFFDLPNDIKFANMFLLDTKSVGQINNNKNLHRHNLLYFEILNKLISFGHKINSLQIKDNSFIFFNKTRQKNAIIKFIKRHQN
jgi:hypothetical protein